MKKIIFMISVIIVFASCVKVENTKHFETQDRDLNQFQKIIIDILQNDHELKITPFVSYEVMSVDTDSFYERFYLWVLIDYIDFNLTVKESFSYPFALTFDKKSKELIRYFYPDDEGYKIEDINVNFTQEARRNFLSISQDQHIYRIEKLRDSNLWDAKKYYGLE